MMIVDLIDEVDFIDKLKYIGVPVTYEMPLLEVQAELLSWLQKFPAQQSSILALFEEIQGSNVTLLPEINKAIEVVVERINLN